MNAIYTTREGHRWELEDVVPSLVFPGFMMGNRKPDGKLVHVHHHRLRFDVPAPPEQSPPAIEQGANAS